MSLLCVLMTASGAARAALPPAGAEAERRAAARQIRLQWLREYRLARARDCAAALAALETAARECLKEGAGEAARAALAAIRGTDQAWPALAELESAAQAPPAAGAPPPPLKTATAARLNAARRALAEALFGLARRCYNSGCFVQAYDLLQEITALEPDHAASRGALGQQKVEGRWCSEWEARQSQAGLLRHPELGWIPRTQSAPIAQGKWPEQGRWLELAEADRLHARLQNPWVLETEHFTLRSTAGRAAGWRMAGELDAIRRFCFRQFLPFFLRGSPRHGSQLLFNSSAGGRLLVFYCGSKEHFEELILRDFPGAAKDLLLRSDGFFSLSRRTSYFYALPRPDDVLAVMRHELTHHILGLYAGNNGPLWLNEGVAVLLGQARPDAAGRLILPEPFPDSVSIAQLLQTGSLPDLAAWLSLSEKDFHDPEIRSRNYLLAGSFCHFLFSRENGLYAPDFLEMLYDVSLSRREPDLEIYLGADANILEKEFHAHLRSLLNLKPPSAPPAPPTAIRAPG